MLLVLAGNRGFAELHGKLILMVGIFKGENSVASHFCFLMLVLPKTFLEVFFICILYSKYTLLTFKQLTTHNFMDAADSAVLLFELDVQWN